MTLKLALAGALLAAAYVVPAVADTSYYIVQDTGTKHCKIVSQKPVSRTVTVVGEDGYPTEVAAQDAMKTVKVCTHD